MDQGKIERPGLEWHWRLFHNVDPLSGRPEDFDPLENGNLDAPDFLPTGSHRYRPFLRISTSGVTWRY